MPLPFRRLLVLYLMLLHITLSWQLRKNLSQKEISFKDYTLLIYV